MRINWNNIFINWTFHLLKMNLGERILLTVVIIALCWEIIIITSRWFERQLTVVVGLVHVYNGFRIDEIRQETDEMRWNSWWSCFLLYSLEFCSKTTENTCKCFYLPSKKKRKLMNYWTNQKEYHIETYVFLRKAIEDSKKMVSRHTQKQPCYNIVLLIMANNWYYIG